MTLIDFFKEIIDNSRERIKTPISGAYGFAFIIWNWRPLILLFFEKATITEKIIIINSEYCNASAIYVPFLLGLFFTIVIPYIMSALDILLKPAIKWRLSNLYDSKKQILQNQILLVDKELELQDKKSRSKEKADFEQQIEDLEKRLKVANETHKTVISDYENKIAEMIEMVNNSNLRQKQTQPINSDINFVEMLVKNQFSIDEIDRLHKLPNSLEEPIDIVKIGYKMINFLKTNSFTEDQPNNKTHLSTNGLEFVKWIKNNNIKYSGQLS